MLKYLITLAAFFCGGCINSVPTTAQNRLTSPQVSCATEQIPDLVWCSTISARLERVNSRANSYVVYFDLHQGHILVHQSGNCREISGNFSTQRDIISNIVHIKLRQENSECNIVIDASSSSTSSDAVSRYIAFRNADGSIRLLF